MRNEDIKGFGSKVLGC